MTKVSVLMPSYNYACFLPLAISSVLSQSYSDIELIIVDDCSTDGSRAIIEDWKKRDDRIVSVYHDRNRGLSAARNTGLSASSGAFIALCDSDDIWLEHKLKTQMDQFHKDPELGVVHSDSAIIDRNSELTGQRFGEMFLTPGQNTSGLLFEELCERNFICVPTVVLRREAVEFAEGFDESIRSLEDWVCWTKISTRYSFFYIDEALAQYRIHGSGLSSNSNNMAENRIKAIEILLEFLSDLRPETKSRMMYSLGRSHQEVADFSNASKAFLRSLQLNPWEGRSWVRYVQSLLERAQSRYSHG
jgi:teichuronic acid biosynthesis glycosyltransferase TuaG